MSNATQQRYYRLVVQQNGQRRYSSWKRSTEELAQHMPDILRDCAFGGLFTYADGTTAQNKPHTWLTVEYCDGLPEHALGF